MTARSENPIGAAAYAPESFQIAVEAEHDGVTITPRGELDLATAGQLHRELEQAIEAGPGRIVIDLRGVEFLDSTGLHALLSAHAQTQHGNRELAIIPGPRAVQRIFEITGTIDRLPFATGNGRAPSP